MAYGGQNKHEPMDYESSDVYARSLSHGTSRRNHCGKYFGFYSSIKEELIRHFYGSILEEFLDSKCLEVTGNHGISLRCISSSTEDCRYVHKRMQEIEKDVRDMDMYSGCVYTPVALKRADSDIEDKIISYVKQRTSDYVYMKYDKDFKCVKIYSKYSDSLQHEKERLEQILKQEAEALQAKEKKVLDQSKRSYDTDFPPLITTNDRPTQTPPGAWQGGNASIRGSPMSVTSTSQRKKAINIIYPFLRTAPVFTTPEGIGVYLRLCSITDLQVDVVVNAANERLFHGKGVAKAIADAGGSALIDEGNRIIRQKGPVSVTDNVTTSAGNLPCQKVIHAVGPKWDDYQNKVDCLKHLSETVKDALKTASEFGYKTVALPAISSGIYGVPKWMCAKMYIRAIIKFSKMPKGKSVRKIVLVDLTKDILDEVVAAHREWLVDPNSIKPSIVLNLVNRGGQVSPGSAALSPLVYPYGSAALSPLVYPDGNVSRQHPHGNKDSSHSPPKHTKLWTQMSTQKIPKQQELVHCFEIDDGFLQVKIYTGSIVKVKDMSGIVCSADTSLSGMGPLNEAIAREGGPKYDRAFQIMQERFKSTKTVGDIISCSGGDLGTKYVVHVIMTQLSTTLDYRLQEHKKHILNVLLKADEWSMKKIALPLIGGGFVEKDEKDLEKLCKVFYEAVTEYCQQVGSARLLREIHFINRNPGITKAIVKCFQEHSSPPSDTVRRQITDPGKSDNKPSASHDQGARPKSRIQSIKNRDSNDFPKHDKIQGGNKRNTSHFNKSYHVSSNKGEFSSNDSNRARPKSGSLDDRHKHNTDFRNTPHRGGSGAGKPKQTNRYGIPDMFEDDLDEKHDFGTELTEESLSLPINFRSSATAKTAEYCDSCNKKLMGEIEELPCGHVFCKLPCFIPMEENRVCFICLKNSQNPVLNSWHGPSSDGQEETEEKTCVICMDTIKKGKKLKCGHEFCDDCIMLSFRHKPVCPTCGAIFGALEGDQPDGGKMSVKIDKHKSLPGYEGFGTIEIFYSFRDGIQQENHPEPGKPYKGTERRAFLPRNKEGIKVLNLLQVAFDRKLTFTIGSSRTTGAENVVTWNDIHHKTKRDTGAARFGYPDPTYLTRVQDELAAKGITEDCLSDDDL